LAPRAVTEFRLVRRKADMDALNTTVLLALAIFVGVDALFLRITRRSHPDVWEELDSPGMLHSDPNKIYRYFLHRRYRDIPYPRLVLFCDFILFTQIVAFALLMWFAVLLVTFWVPRWFSA